LTWTSPEGGRNQGVASAQNGKGRRAHAGAIEIRVLREVKVILGPPGFEAKIAEFFDTE
jgi:hypothetical protein